MVGGTTSKKKEPEECFAWFHPIQSSWLFSICFLCCAIELSAISWALGSVYLCVWAFIAWEKNAQNFCCCRCHPLREQVCSPKFGSVSYIVISGALWFWCLLDIQFSWFGALKKSRGLQPAGRWKCWLERERRAKKQRSRDFMIVRGQIEVAARTLEGELPIGRVDFCFCCSIFGNFLGGRFNGAELFPSRVLWIFNINLSLKLEKSNIIFR